MPHAPEAEIAVLGAVLLLGSCASVGLVAEHFFDPRHRAIAEAMLVLDAEQVPIDEVTLSDRLQRAGRLDVVGGIAYLSQIALAVPTADHADSYAAIVRDKAVSRNVMLVLGEMLEAARRGAMEGDELLSGAQERLRRVTPAGTVKGAPIGQIVRDEIPALFKLLDRQAHGEKVFTGIPTGFARLDALTSGIPRGVLTVIAARPAGGKTTLAMALLDVAERVGCPGLMFSFEDRRQSFAHRMLGRGSGVAIEKIRALDLDLSAMEALTEATNELGRRGWWLIESAGMDIDQVVRVARQHVRERGVQLIVVDYLQKVRRPRGADVKMRRDEEIGASTLALSNLAAELDIAVVANSQVNRASLQNDDKRPTLAGLKDSGRIEEDGKLIVGMYRDAEFRSWGQLSPHEKQNYAGDEETWQSTLELLVLKNHQGASRRRVSVRWQRAIGRITDWPQNSESYQQELLRGESL